VFSIADLHGDYDQFKMILTRLGLASFNGFDVTWTGGNAILVSTGDTVDRGIHSRPIYLAFMELARQAAEQGGEVVNLLGNHELMNLQEDYRYVPEAEMKPSGDYGGLKNRIKEWGPDGIIGKDMRSRYKAAVVRKRVLYVHAGLDPEIMGQFGSGSKGLDALNARVMQLIKAGDDSDEILRTNGPLWNRFFASGKEKDVCKSVEETLKLVGADRMVVGHTVQTDGINVRCVGPKGPRIILADTSISKDMMTRGGRASGVEVIGNNVTAIYFPEGKAAPQTLEEEFARHQLTMNR